MSDVSVYIVYQESPERCPLLLYARCATGVVPIVRYSGTSSNGVDGKETLDLGPKRECIVKHK